MEIKYNDHILNVSITDTAITLSTDSVYTTSLYTMFSLKAMLYITGETSGMDYLRFILPIGTSDLAIEVTKDVAFHMVKSGYYLKELDDGFEVRKNLK